MLEDLLPDEKVKIQEMIEQVVGKDIENRPYMFHGLLREYKGPNSSDYLAGVIRLKVVDLLQLSTTGLEYFVVSLTRTIKDKPNYGIGEDLERFMDPDAKANMIRHELEHALAHPESERSNLVIDILFSTSDPQSEKFDELNAAIFDTRLAAYIMDNPLTDYERAIIASAPSSLGNSDIVKSAFIVKQLRGEAEAVEGEERAKLLGQAEEIEQRYNSRQWHGKRGEVVKDESKILSIQESISIHPELESILVDAA